MNRLENPRSTEEIIIGSLRGNTAPAPVFVSRYWNQVPRFEAQCEPPTSDWKPAIVKAVASANGKNRAASFGAYAKPNTIEKQFRFFADRWYETTRRDSSITRITSNENYFKVIGLGRDVIPLILKELKSKPAPWFLALRVLSGNSEVGRGFPGDFEKIANAWIRWGEERGLI